MKQTTFLFLLIAVALSGAACTQLASNEELKKQVVTVADTSGLSRVALLTRHFEQFPPTTPEEKAFLEQLQYDQAEVDSSEGREELPE